MSRPSMVAQRGYFEASDYVRWTGTLTLDECICSLEDGFVELTLVAQAHTRILSHALWCNCGTVSTDLVKRRLHHILLSQDSRRATAATTRARRSGKLMVLC